MREPGFPSHSMSMASFHFHVILVVRPLCVYGNVRVHGHTRVQQEELQRQSLSAHTGRPVSAVCTWGTWAAHTLLSVMHVPKPFVGTVHKIREPLQIARSAHEGVPLVHSLSVW